MENKDLIKVVEQEGSNARGRKEYLKFLRGEKNSLGQAVRAQCYACMGYYVDGKVDCGGKGLCPLFSFYRYSTTGLVKKPKRQYTAEEKRAIVERLQKARFGKVKTKKEK